MEISNSLVAVLVLAAIVVSVAGTMTTLNIISEFAIMPGDLTGHIAGTVNVTVNESVIVNFVTGRDNMNFTLNTPESGLTYTDDTTDDDPLPFKIRNDGSVTVNVSIMASHSLFNQSWNTIQYKCGDTTVGACDTTGGTPSSTTTYTNITSSASLAIYNMSYTAPTNDEDQLEIEINVSVPANEPAGEKKTTITLTATQACPGAHDC